MRPELRGKVLFVFSDPGGAKPCLALIEENNLHNALAVSDRQQSFYKDFKTSVRVINHDYEKLILDNKPELIFAGTSYTSDIEQQFIKIAKKNKIKCYSFVDHWTSISNRFKNSNGEMTLPDKVWVIDERAKRIAIGEGIEKDEIIISGNPYHEWLKNWKPRISKEGFLEQLGLQQHNKKILLYAPDPLSNINGKEKYGFDELSATSLLVELFRTKKAELNDWRVLVKAHPNQDRKKLEKILSNCQSIQLLPEDIDANSTIYFSDIVMGFFSSFLIESSIIGKPVLRFFSEQPRIDPFEELNIGIVVDKKSLISTLKFFPDVLLWDRQTNLLLRED